MNRITIYAYTFVLIACLLIGCNATSNETNSTDKDSILDAPSNNTTNFYSFSDIHFNPFYDPSLLQSLAAASVEQWDSIFQNSSDKSYGSFDNKDANYNLFASALENAKKVEAEPDFVIISGDFITHNYETLYQGAFGNQDSVQMDEFLFKTISFVIKSLKKTFPKAYFYPVLGNNDSFCGDYMITPNGSFLERFAPIWRSMLNNSVDPKVFNETFKKGGYYTAQSPHNPKHRIIGLNSILFSPNFQNSASGWPINYCQELSPAAAKAAAEDQLTWLETQLKQAKKNQEKLWLIYHIPPGINAYQTIKNGGPAACNPAMYWKEEYNQKFIELMSKDAEVITAQFGGHSHMDNFLVISDSAGQAKSFCHITPAISPKFGNNPGFFLYTYTNATSVVKNYKAHYFTGVESPANAVWKEEYDFATIYQQPELTAANFAAISKEMESNQSLRKHYIDYFIVDDLPESSIDSTNWSAYQCAFTATSKEAYSACYCTSGQ